MKKQIIESKSAPAPIGPYNQAVAANGLLFMSGQIALIPGTDELVLDSIENETTQVMKNLQAVLSEACINFDHVIKTSIFLTDMADFAKVNAVYATYFNRDFPARETIAVKGLPKGVRVEISMIASMNI